jgi:dimethylglycine dehydrogenase
LDKDFLNKQALVDNLKKRPRENLVLIHLDEEDCNLSKADATGGEPIFKNGKGLGRITSGAYGYSVGMSLALGYVKDVVPGDTVDVMVLGRPHRGKILEAPPFDPEGKILRS